MDLEDVKFTTIIDPLPPLGGGKVPIKDAEVEEDDVVMCAKCQTEGSAPLPNGTCDTCGQAWEDYEPVTDSDFDIALELLQSCLTELENILGSEKLVHKMSLDFETRIRDLATSVDDFLDTYTELADDEDPSAVAD